MTSATTAGCCCCRRRRLVVSLFVVLLLLLPSADITSSSASAADSADSSYQCPYFGKYCTCSEANPGDFRCRNGDLHFRLDYQMKSKLLVVYDHVHATDWTTTSTAPPPPVGFRAPTDTNVTDGLLPNDLLSDSPGFISVLRVQSGHISSLDNLGWFGQEAEVSVLEVFTSSLTSFKENFFTDLPKLTLVMVMETKVRLLPRLGARGQCNLRNLWVQGNAHLEEFAANFVASCANLQNADLADNALSALSADLFRNSLELQTVSLHRNNLTSLPDRFFSTNRKLEDVDLSWNAISSLPVNLFQPWAFENANNSKVRFLDVSHNLLTELPETLVSTLDKLEELDLSFNQVRVLPDRFLGACRHLRILNLRRNQLQDLAEDLVHNCANLYVLILDHNAIANLPDNLLATCNKLSSLSLDHNRIQTLPPRILQRCDRLLDLSLIGNHINQIPSQGFLSFSQLSSVNLRGNNITQLEDNMLCNLTSLEKLDLSNNELVTLNPIIVKLPSYKPFVFNISGNKLETLRTATFENAGLPTVLDASRNHFESLEPGWNLGLQWLVALHLNDNLLHRINRTDFANLMKLTNLTLSGNRLMFIHSLSFVSTPLQYLDLSRNALHSATFDSAFYLPAELKWINVSHNNLSVGGNGVPSSLRFVPVIDLRNNSFDEIDVLLFLSRIAEDGGNLAKRSFFVGCEFRCQEIEPHDLLQLGDNCAMNRTGCGATTDCPSGCECIRTSSERGLGAMAVRCGNVVPHVLPPTTVVLRVSSSNTSIIELVDLSSWAGLQHLSLRRSMLADAMNSLKHLLVRLVSLDLSLNRIEERFGFVGSFSRLEELNLSRNLIPNLVDSVFENSSKLIILDLSFNRIRAVTRENFKGLTSLTMLHLNGNLISQLPDNLLVNVFSTLTHLYLNDNQINDISDDAFIHRNVNKPEVTMQLKTLHLSGNRLEFSLETDMFLLPESLLTLDLSHNKIGGNFELSFFPAGIMHLNFLNNSLRFVNISKDNGVTTNSNLFHQQNFFRFVDIRLQTNRIEGVNVDNDIATTTVYTLFARDNLLVCDFRLLSLLRQVKLKQTKLNPRLKRKRINVLLADDVTCHEPQFVRGKTVTKLDKDDLLYPSKMDTNINNQTCPEGCQCYRKTTGKKGRRGVTTGYQIVDCAKSSNHALFPRNDSSSSPPLRNVKALYLNDTNALSAAGYYGNLTELHVDNCCTQGGGGGRSEMNTTFLETLLPHLQKLTLDDKCWCKPRDYVSYHLDGFVGTCDRPLPPPTCVPKSASSKTGGSRDRWTFVKCSGTFRPPPQMLHVPICYVRDGCQQPDCSCYLNANMSLVMNCSKAAMTQLPTVAPPDVHVLDMDGNRLRQLHGLDHPRWTNLAVLYARDNMLVELSDDRLPARLELVMLDGNRLTTPTGWLQAMMQSDTTFLPRVTLSRNSWNCDCVWEDGTNNFDTWSYLTFTRLVLDVNQTYCTVDGNQRLLLETYRHCQDLTSSYNHLVIWLPIAIALGALAAVTIGTTFYYRHNKAVKVWLFTHRLCACLLDESNIDEDKEFDAFISYSSEDAPFVASELLPGLEGTPSSDPRYRYKICIHDRDWLGGEFIPDQIVQSVQNSRRTIIVLSRSFLSSSWATMEFKIALQQALEDRINRIIVVLPDRLPPKEDMDPDLRMYVTMNTYLPYSDPKFWDRIRYAMPHKTRSFDSNSSALLRRLPSNFEQLMITSHRMERPEDGASKTVATDAGHQHGSSITSPTDAGHPHGPPKATTDPGH